MSDVFMHRSTPALWGKCTETVKARIPGEMFDALQQRARSLGMTDAELLREIIAVSLYGVEHVASMHRQRLMQVAGMGPESGQ